MVLEHDIEEINKKIINLSNNVNLLGQKIDVAYNDLVLKLTYLKNLLEDIYKNNLQEENKK